VLNEKMFILHFKNTSRAPLRFINRVFSNDAFGPGASGWYVYPDRISAPYVIKDSDILTIEAE